MYNECLGLHSHHVWLAPTLGSKRQRYHEVVGKHGLTFQSGCQWARVAIAATATALAFDIASNVVYHGLLLGESWHMLRRMAIAIIINIPLAANKMESSVGDGAAVGLDVDL